MSKKHVIVTLPALVDERTFFSRGDEECCHSILMLLVAGSKWWHHVSLAAMILERNWFPIACYRIRCCMEVDMRWIFCFSVKYFHYAQTFRYCNLSCNMVCIHPLLIDMSSAISQVVIRWLILTRQSTSETASLVITTCAWPGRDLSSLLLLPLWKFLHHRNINVSAIHSFHSTIDFTSTHVFHR